MGPHISKSLRPGAECSLVLGVLHFSDGSYLDWFLPHLSTTILSRDHREWKRRDVSHIAVSQGGLFHDAVHGRSERFKRVRVEKDRQDNNLPRFHVKLKNGRTTIDVTVRAVARAIGTFINRHVEASGRT